MSTLRRLAWRAWEPLSGAAGRAYVAGPSARDAVRAGRALRARGQLVTIGLWDAPGDSRDDVAAQCSEAASLLDPGLGFHLALKPPALEFDADRLGRLAATAARAGSTVHLDAHQVPHADRTLALASRLQRVARVRVALPARWRRSIGDADRVVEEGAQARIVKGEWPDPGDPGRDPRDGFLELVDHLAGRAATVAVATHDAPLAAEALRRLRAAGTPAELELLLGLPSDRPLAAARELGVPVRVYVPFGRPFTPYTLSELRNDRRVLLWLAHDAWRGARRPPHARRRPAADLTTGTSGW